MGGFKWTLDEEQKLKELYPVTNNSELINFFNGRTEQGIVAKAIKKLGLHKDEEFTMNSGNNWNNEDTEKLKLLYPNNKNYDIAIILSKPEKCILYKANKLKLYKSDEYKLLINGEKIYDSEEDKKLMELYPYTRNQDLAIIFNVKESNITSKAQRMGFKKTKEHRSKMIGKRNKMIGRDLSFEFVRDIAKQYSSRGEFQLGDGGAYQTALRAGWLDEICGHMIAVDFSLPQLIMKSFLLELLKLDKYEMHYNTRKIIKPLELDIWIPKYMLAFEYDGKGWHLNDKHDKTQLCKDKDILLITFIENSRRYEEDIKNQLIEHLYQINNRTNFSITEEQITNLIIPKDCFDDILDKDKINEICQKYTVLSDFMRDNINLYQKIIKLGALEEFTGHMERKQKPEGFWSNPDNIKKVVDKHVILKTFIEQDFACYNYIMKHKEHLPLIAHLKKGGVKKVSRSKWSNPDDIIKLVSKYTRLKDFREENSACYYYILEHEELLPLIEHLTKGQLTRREKLIENSEETHKICKEYSVFKIFKKEHLTLYVKIQKAGMLKEFTGHMFRERKVDYWNEETIKEVVSKYEWLSDFKNNEKDCFSYIDKRPELKLLIVHLKRGSKSKSELIAV
jgi:hypothetical protein